MRIERIYNTFTDLVDIGRLALFIEMNTKGSHHNVEDVVEQAKHFNLVVLNGADPFHQREDVAEFIKKYKKANPFGSVQVITDGVNRPVSLNNQKDVTYIVGVGLKNSGIPYEKRVDEKALKWFRDAPSAYFVFMVFDEDDFDEVGLIVSSVEIRKHQVFIIPSGNIQDICLAAKVRKYNITFKVGPTIWGDLDDEEGGCSSEHS
jgi:hypothetical protein